MVHRILRVDHAGEFGANRIYAGQMAVLGRSKIGPLIQVSNTHGTRHVWTGGGGDIKDEHVVCLIKCQSTSNTQYNPREIPKTIDLNQK